MTFFYRAASPLNLKDENEGMLTIFKSNTTLSRENRGDFKMPESPLRTLLIDFAVKILNLVKQLRSRHETIVSNQIGRAGAACSQIRVLLIGSINAERAV